MTPGSKHALSASANTGSPQREYMQLNVLGLALSDKKQNTVGTELFLGQEGGEGTYIYMVTPGSKY